MDFIPRGGERGPTHPSPHPGHASPAMPEAAHHPHHPPRRKHIDWETKSVRLELFIVTVGSALLLAALALYLGLSGNVGLLNRQINKTEYQAVFLNSGQIYFGKITNLNEKYIVLKNVFYTDSSQANATAQNQNSYILHKLGAEFYVPEDQVVFNQSEVSFWENLKTTSPVVTKINDYYRNPSSTNSN